MKLSRWSIYIAKVEKSTTFAPFHEIHHLQDIIHDGSIVVKDSAQSNHFAVVMEMKAHLPLPRQKTNLKIKPRKTIPKYIYFGIIIR